MRIHLRNLRNLRFHFLIRPIISANPRDESATDPRAPRLAPRATLSSRRSAMARLHEYQGKALLAKHGFTVPRGAPASSPEQAADVARQLGGPVVIKIQAWTTGRAALG